jgi:hypothetical protein
MEESAAAEFQDFVRERNDVVIAALRLLNRGSALRIAKLLDRIVIAHPDGFMPGSVRNVLRKGEISVLRLDDHPARWVHPAGRWVQPEEWRRRLPLRRLYNPAEARRWCECNNPEVLGGYTPKPVEAPRAKKRPVQSALSLLPDAEAESA